MTEINISLLMEVLLLFGVICVLAVLRRIEELLERIAAMQEGRE